MNDQEDREERTGAAMALLFSFLLFAIPIIWVWFFYPIP